MKTRIVRIGNSQGIRIPKVFLEEVGLGDEVELEARADHLVIRPARAPRQGWEQQFQSMAQRGDDRLLDAEVVPTEWESQQWQW